MPDCIRSWIQNEPVEIRSPNSTRPWQHVLEPLSGYLSLGMSLSKNRNNSYAINLPFGKIKIIKSKKLRTHLLDKKKFSDLDLQLKKKLVRNKVVKISYLINNVVYEKLLNEGLIDNEVKSVTEKIEKVLKQKVIFIAVPIRSFKSLIQLIAPKLRNDTTLIDVCSVKTYPVQVMKENLNKNIGIIATHPMFGPDSFQTNNKLKMMMNKVNDPNNQFDVWKEFFENQRIKIIEMSPDDHDKMAAQSQGVTHFLGRMLKQFGIDKTSIDTQGFKDLLDLVDQTCNDTWELYTDLQLFNPYTMDVISRLKSSTEQLHQQLEEYDNVDTK